jgi:hypothetical protein
MHLTALALLPLALVACSGTVATHDGAPPVASSGDAGPVGDDPEVFGQDGGGSASVDLAPPPPDLSPPPPLKPDASPVQSYGACKTSCAGTSHLLHNAKYNKWVKVVLCTPSRYDIFMGEQQSGPFYKVGDTAGHGQDHCELVNPSFTLTHEDNIDSGSCPTCKEKSAGSVAGIPWLWGTPMYWRSALGQPFNFGLANKQSINTSCWYECGVSF